MGGTFSAASDPGGQLLELAYRCPASGVLEGNLQAGGSLAEPSAAGTLVLHKVRLYDETVELVRANLELSTSNSGWRISRWRKTGAGLPGAGL